LTENQLFDLIVSNPPYFPDHFKSKNSKRNQALHTDALSFNELIQKSVNLLQQEGKIWIILPPRQLDDFTELAEKAGLFPYREVGVRDTGDKPVIRKILGFSRSQVIPLREELILKKENGVFSDSYRDLISGFLLGF
jgi:tRNA1Val (adenine37-N6)-methyltransferase